jgi:hypothetical protein
MNTATARYEVRVDNARGSLRFARSGAQAAKDLVAYLKHTCGHNGITVWLDGAEVQS